MKWLRRLLWAFLGLVLILLTAVGFVLSTQTGLDGVLALAQKVAPGTLTYQQIQGRLIGPLLVKDLEYQDGDLSFTLKQAELDWRPGDLLSAKLAIGKLQADGIAIHLPPSAPPEPVKAPFTLSDISLPLGIDIGDIKITDIRIFPYGMEQPQVIDEVVLKAATQNQTVVVKTLTIKAPQGELQLDGKLEPVGAYPLTVNLGAQFHHPQYGTLNTEAVVQGKLNDTLALRLSTTGLATVSLDGEVNQVFKEPDWKAQFNVDMAELGRVAPELAATGLSAHLQTQGTMQDFQLRGELNSTVPEVGPLAATFTVAGNTQAVHVRELVLRAAKKPLSLTAQGDVDLAQQAVNAKVRWQNLAWPLNGPPQVESPSGELTLQGSLQAYGLELKAALAGRDIGALNAHLKANGTPQNIRFNEVSLRAPSGELALDARGELGFAGLDFAASGEWKGLAWPLAGIPQVQSPAGAFKAHGNPNDYQFELDTQVQGRNVPQGTWRFEGQGSAQALAKLNLTGKLLEGEITGTARAAWKPAVNWQAELAGSGLNPAAQWPELPGKLAFKLRTQGELVAEGVTAHLDLADLSGTLNKQDVQGKAQLTVNNQDLAMQNLSLRAGDARLEASGVLTQRWDMGWRLEVPALNRLLPGAAGAIKGSGKLAGPRDQPQASLDLGVRGLAYGDTKIQRLQGEARLDLSGSTQSRLKIQGEGLNLAGKPWDKLNLDGSGTPAQHTVQAGLAGQLGNFALAIEGGLKGQSWQGRLTRLTAQKTTVGNWNLERPVSLQVSAEQAKAESICLASSPTRLCLQGQWAAKTGAEGKLNLERLRPERFAAFLPEHLRLDTSLSGEVNGTLQANGAVQGKALVRLDPGSLDLSVDGQPVKISLGGGSLQADSNGKDASAKLGLDLGKLGQINGDMQLKDIPGQRRVGGTLTGEIKDLSLVSTLTPQLQAVSGRLAANLELAGTLPMLQLKGAVRLENAAAEVPAAAIRLQDIKLEATSDGRGPLQVFGSARSGAGKLEVSGQVDPLIAALDLAIQGDHFQVANSPEIQALISPKLKLSVTSEQVRVDGEVVVPKAYLSPPGGTTGGGVSPSQDVVIVNQGNGSPTTRKGGPAVYAKLRVTLGDDVQVAAAGFKGKLSGSLLVEQTPQLAPRGTGSLAVASGEYRIYGQDLRIERGRVLFSGSPVDNPGLDLRVARQFSNTDSGTQVTAGAEVTGTLKRPKMTLYSTPTMADTSIISYLVLGRAPDQTSKSENAMLYRAASALGGGLLTRVSGATGLDDLKFESGASAQQASVVLGKYLTPDLYVSYGVGLFDKINAFRLRYRFSRRFSLEATNTATGTGADLLYTIER